MFSVFLKGIQFLAAFHLPTPGRQELVTLRVLSNLCSYWLVISQTEATVIIQL